MEPVPATPVNQMAPAFGSRSEARYHVHGTMHNVHATQMHSQMTYCPDCLQGCCPQH